MKTHLYYYAVARKPMIVETMYKKASCHSSEGECPSLYGNSSRLSSMSTSGYLMSVLG